MYMYIHRYCTYKQHLLTILATMLDSMPRVKTLGNNNERANAKLACAGPPITTTCTRKREELVKANNLAILSFLDLLYYSTTTHTVAMHTQTSNIGT